MGRKWGFYVQFDFWPNKIYYSMGNGISGYSKTTLSILQLYSRYIRGRKVTFDLNYEPTSLGKKTTTMVISSPSGCDYTFPLVGTCTEPKPQGPFIIRAKSSCIITFKNIFNKPTEFNMVRLH